MRRFLDILLAILLLAGICVAVIVLAVKNEENYFGRFKVLDGDTLLNNGQKLRLIGIDAPEYSQRCINSKGSWQCGRVATHTLRQLVRNSAELVCTGNQIDKYARPLVTCFSNDKDINALMVSGGFAVAYGAYYAEERDARNNKRGIWQGEFLRPQDWRRAHYGSLTGDDIKEFIANIWASCGRFYLKYISVNWS